MNYETTIRAEAADGVNADYTGEYAGARSLAAPAIPRWHATAGVAQRGFDDHRCAI